MSTGSQDSALRRLVTGLTCLTARNLFSRSEYLFLVFQTQFRRLLCRMVVEWPTIVTNDTFFIIKLNMKRTITHYYWWPLTAPLIAALRPYAPLLSLCPHQSNHSYVSD